jgi:hypothetical protein
VNAPPVWRQYLAARGESAALLERCSNIARRDCTATVILRGAGPFFPQMHGSSWAAMCDPRQVDDVALGDLTPILRLLLDSTMLPQSNAPRAELEAWLCAYQGRAR